VDRTLELKLIPAHCSGGPSARAKAATGASCPFEAQDKEPTPSPAYGGISRSNVSLTSWHQGLRGFMAFANKGRIALGADADLTLVDLERRVTLTNSRMRSACGWTPFGL
jgi:hypothetical protein